jgi:phosphate transport system substrate-binding protein
MDANSLTGAGSTFVYPVMTRWISNYQQNHSGVRINYQSIGSGGGIQQLKKGLVDFGTSDAAIDDNQLKEMNAVVQIPDSAGPVCVTYNLPNLAQPLRLSGDTLAGIYLGTITNWQDAKLKKDNPNVSLPNLPIIVAHRSDGSGTSNIFTTYLSKVSPDWQKKVGQGVSVCWPVGIGGKGSEGVTGVVKQSPGAIGYVELTYAKENNLPVAMVRNEVGDYVAPSPEGTTAAINAYSDQLSQDVRTPIVDPPNTAKDAYPIAGLTFILVAKDGNDPVRRQNIKDFIKDVITNGQDVAQQMNYAKLPDSLQQQDQKLLAEMTANGQPLK